MSGILYRREKFGHRGDTGKEGQAMVEAEMGMTQLQEGTSRTGSNHHKLKGRGVFPAGDHSPAHTLVSASGLHNHERHISAVVSHPVWGVCYSSPGRLPWEC